jgi:hypothetical protein
MVLFFIHPLIFRKAVACNGQIDGPVMGQIIRQTTNLTRP